MATATETKVTETNILEAQPRTPGTKNDARRVRRSGKIPAVLYGAGKDVAPLSVDPRQVLRIADLPHSDKFKVLTDENQSVAHIISVKEEAAPAPEAVAAEAAAVPAEPEVIKKGKQEAEEEAAEEGGAEKAAKTEKKEKK